MGFESLYKLSVIMQVVDSVSGPMQNIGQATQSNVSGIDKLSQSFANMQKTGVVMAGRGYSLQKHLRHLSRQPLIRKGQYQSCLPLEWSSLA